MTSIILGQIVSCILSTVTRELYIYPLEEFMSSPSVGGRGCTKFAGCDHIDLIKLDDIKRF